MSSNLLCPFSTALAAIYFKRSWQKEISYIKFGIFSIPVCLENWIKWVTLLTLLCFVFCFFLIPRPTNLKVLDKISGITGKTHWWQKQENQSDFLIFWFIYFFLIIIMVGVFKHLNNKQGVSSISVKISLSSRSRIQGSIKEDFISLTTSQSHLREVCYVVGWLIGWFMWVWWVCLCFLLDFVLYF